MPRQAPDRFAPWSAKVVQSVVAVADIPAGPAKNVIDPLTDAWLTSVVDDSSAPGWAGSAPGPRSGPTACAVLMPDDPKTVGLRLSAYYPPFAYEARRGVGPDQGAIEPGTDGSLSWATAKCPGGTAVYLGNRLAPMDASARDAFAAFARHSAERHGCSAPALP
ncbi:hypothetical protein ACFYST_02030 [Kitasatospora sp. NPDC004614]|uniref:hypothetical protein n=1 Tax=unclassified Kitasatospora TaxID=2633591 RepID=UPI0036993A07